MKKIIAIIAVIMLVGCLSVVLTGCGGDNDMTNTDTSLTATSEKLTDDIKNNPGSVTDESVKGENGVIGDIVTDISDGISKAVTDISEGASKLAE